MKTTAMYFSPSGAQRVEVLGYVDADGYEDPNGHAAKIRTRDGDEGIVVRDQLMSFREEEDEQ